MSLTADFAMTIDGKAVKSKARLPVVNPATGAPFAECPDCSREFFSFWDDPTHLKPWSPAALYRLAISFGFRPTEVGYFGTMWDKVLLPLHTIKAWISGDRHALTNAVWKAHKWACGMVAEKPPRTAGKPDYVYLSLKDLPRGADSALAFRNGRKAPAER